MELRGNNAVAGCGGLDFGFYFAFQCGVQQAFGVNGTEFFERAHA